MLTERQIDAAVAWWVAAIDGQPKFDNLGHTRGRDAEETRLNSMASILTGMTAQAYLPSPESLLAFEAALREIIRGFDSRDHLSVDYHPDQFLRAAAAASGINDSRFPWKTIMWFDRGGVQVAHGYGAPIQELLDVAVTA